MLLEANSIRKNTHGVQWHVKHCLSVGLAHHRVLPLRMLGWIAHPHSCPASSLPSLRSSPTSGNSPPSKPILIASVSSISILTSDSASCFLSVSCLRLHVESSRGYGDTGRWPHSESPDTNPVRRRRSRIEFFRKTAIEEEQVKWNQQLKYWGVWGESWRFHRDAFPAMSGWSTPPANDGVKTEVSKCGFCVECSQTPQKSWKPC